MDEWANHPSPAGLGGVSPHPVRAGQPLEAAKRIVTPHRRRVASCLRGDVRAEGGGMPDSTFNEVIGVTSLPAYAFANMTNLQELCVVL